MVDFKKRLGSKVIERPIHPHDIYKKLDRASDKGPLRPAQESTLEAWHTKWRHKTDVILKLHTGDGKTLIGLLMLQSKLNELADKGGRALYLCPNNFLVRQTIDQARQFGVTCVPVDQDGELPVSFLDGKAILVAPVQKLFNGLTKFGLNSESERVDSLVMDDAHACIDAIKDAFIVRFARQHQAYQDIITLFGQDIQEQGVGTYAELRARETTAFLPVPYWAWIDRHRDVASLLTKYLDAKELRFKWPLIRDVIKNCTCIVSGRELVIAPHRQPLELFGSYYDAKHRVFMSATISDDSFLVRGFGLNQEVIANPLTFEEAAWSGEKMVLIPSNIDTDLGSSEVVHITTRPRPKSSYGVVALVPSFDATRDWETEGAVVAKTDDIEEQIERLRSSDRSKTLVIANRYDGIDLPDDTCRILILDGKPFADLLLNRYTEACRPNSAVVALRTARIIEQGMGRAVRGEKDYCVVILSGSDLVRFVRTQEGRAFFSPQTAKQIEIGLTIASFAREEMTENKETPGEVLSKLIRQSLSRDEGWKDYYVEQMNTLAPAPSPSRLLDVFAIELKAERLYEAGKIDEAIQELQNLLDSDTILLAADRGWYLQEMARYRYSDAKSRSIEIQSAAHKQNRYLLKPKSLVRISRLEPIAQRRVERIISWVQQQDDYPTLMSVIDEILGALRFGTRAEVFERAFHNLGIALGFACERPDKEWKAGPDNLWALRNGEYLLVECKSEVEATRAEIGKHETGQMNNASAWFTREYPGVDVVRVLIIPPQRLGPAAGFSDEVVLLRKSKLETLTRNVRNLFTEFRSLDFRDLVDTKIQGLLEQHRLTINDLKAFYYEPPKEP